MRLRLLVLFLSASFVVHAEDMRLQLDQANTKIEFTLTDVLHTVHGDFKLKQGVLKFDSAGEMLSGSFVVDGASGQSGSGARDSRMRNNILEVMRFPEIVFTPDRFMGELHTEGDSQLTMHGIFRIHGMDHEINVPVRVHQAAGGLTADAQLAIPYVKWGMKNPSTLFLRVGDTVTIQVHASGHISRGP